MIVKDSNGELVEVVVGGTWVDDLEILSAVYVKTGLEVGDDEVDYIMANYYEDLAQELVENQMESRDYDF